MRFSKINKRKTLNEREIEILMECLNGLTINEIALAYKIKVGTVRWHLKNIYIKLNVSDISSTFRFIVILRKLLSSGAISYDVPTGQFLWEL